MKPGIDEIRCKGCGICISICPKQVFVLSLNRNSYGTQMPKASKPNDCIGCRMCEKLCPDAAIDIEE